MLWPACFATIRLLSDDSVRELRIEPLQNSVDQRLHVVGCEQIVQGRALYEDNQRLVAEPAGGAHQVPRLPANRPTRASSTGPVRRSEHARIHAAEGLPRDHIRRSDVRAVPQLVQILRDVEARARDRCRIAAAESCAIVDADAC